MNKVLISKVSYAGFDNCLLLSNGIIEIIATTEVGIRIMCFRECGGENIFFEAKSQHGVKNSQDYMIYGGHRLWHTPESIPRTFENDTKEIEYEIIENGVVLKQSIEPNTKMKKTLQVKIVGDRQVEMVHGLKNCGMWRVETSIWGLSMMKTGGTAIISQTKEDNGLLPSKHLTLWSYSKSNDERIRYFENYVTVKQDKENQSKFKVGARGTNNFVAYLNEGLLFIKQFNEESGEYADNSAVEVFTNSLFLELETLGKNEQIESGAEIFHKEMWSLQKTEEEFKDERELENMLRGKLFQ